MSVGEYFDSEYPSILIVLLLSLTILDIQIFCLLPQKLAISLKTFFQTPVPTAAESSIACV